MKNDVGQESDTSQTQIAQVCLSRPDAHIFLPYANKTRSPRVQKRQQEPHRGISVPGCPAQLSTPQLPTSAGSLSCACMELEHHHTSQRPESMTRGGPNRLHCSVMV